MVQNDRIIKAIKALDLPSGHYAVHGSALLEVFGLRRSNDIDLIVTKELFYRLKADPRWRAKTYPEGSTGLECSEIEAYYDCLVIEGMDEAGVRGMIDRATEIDGVYFVNREDTISWKMARDKKQDRSDIELLRSIGGKGDKNKYKDSCSHGC